MPPRGAAVVAALGCLLLGGCASEAPPPAPADSSAPTQTQTQTPTASAEPTVPPAPEVAAIPTDCRSVVDPETYAATFDTVPLDDGEGTGALTPTPAPVGATYGEIISSAVELFCNWDDPASDFTFLQLFMGRVPVNVGKARLDQLAAEGYDCEEVFGGRRCQDISVREGYDVEEGDTHFLRDDVYIRVGQSSFPTTGLLEAVVDRVWN